MNDARSSRTDIRPFRVEIPQAAIDDMRQRIAMTRWPERETVKDQGQGVQLATIQKLAKYWLDEYDWRKVEKRLNSYPNFLTEIDGLDIHFIHVKSKHENALPLIVTHGWPGSIIEQLKIIEPLTDPEKFGGKAEDAFHVVIPSIPGYGFSGKPTETGWNPERIARAWDTLMKRLGYDKYVAQGGDWGAIITDVLAAQAPEGLLGIHTNMANAIPAEIDKAAFGGQPAPAGLSAEERAAYDQLAAFYKHVGYGILMGDRPQTLTAFADSPVGLAAFMIDHDPASCAMIARVFDGVKEGLSRDDVLDNVSLFWLTNTAISAARLYWENKAGFFTPRGVKVPVAVSAFPDELYQMPKSWAEKAYPNLVYYNKQDKGGHFAAWEQPERLVKDVRAGLAPLNP